MDFATAVKLRCFQSVGIAFLFVPINTMVYADVPPEKNNAVSGIVNLARNMGGDIGIATVTTLIARRAQFHQERLAAHADPFNRALMAQLQQIGQALQRAGFSATDATKRAYAMIYGQLQQQAATLAYLDVLVVFAIFTACMVPLVFVTRRARATGGPMAH
jgi:DHA2 family multidrug resistance protein